MPQYLSRRKFFKLTSCAALGAQVRIQTARSDAKRTPLTIANASGSMNLTMAELMRQEKLLESFDLEPNILTVADGTRILGGVVSGSVDLSTMSGFGQAFPAIERGARIKILGGGALLPILGLFSAQPNIKVLKDLEGKTVGTGSIGALIYQLTANLLEKYGVDVSKVRFANIGSSADIFRAVVAGTVDAGAGDVALIDNAAAHHVHLLDHGNMSIELKEYTFQGAWTSDQKIATMRAESRLEGCFLSGTTLDISQRAHERPSSTVELHSDLQAVRREHRAGTRAFSLYADAERRFQSAKGDFAVRAGGRHVPGCGRRQAVGRAPQLTGRDAEMMASNEVSIRATRARLR
jgi:hypothetical protein